MYKKLIKKLKKNEENKNDLSYLNNVKINPEHGKKIAQAYHDMKHDPDHPEVKEAYGALIEETANQFNDLMNKGLKISRIEPGMNNPYKNSKELHADIKNNNHLWYFPTELGYGEEGKETLNHPMLRPTGVKHGDKELLANDMFRIVHDINGHHLGGESGFGSTGEHRAYLTHKKMYSPLAGKALASETMGQNSWVNFGPHGEHNQKNPAQTIYAEQKAGLLPDEVINGLWHEQEDKKPQQLSKKELTKILKDFAIKKSAEYTKKYPEIPKEDLKKNFKTLLRNGVGLLGLLHAHYYMGQPDTTESTRIRQPSAIHREVEKDKRFQPYRDSYSQKTPEDFQQDKKYNKQKKASPPRPGSAPSRSPAISNMSIKDSDSF